LYQSVPSGAASLFQGATGDLKSKPVKRWYAVAAREVRYEHPLWYALRASGRTNGEFVRALNRRRLGTTRTVVRRWMTGQYTPDRAGRHAIAAEFGVPATVADHVPWPDWLPTGEVAGVHEPWTPAGTLTALDALVRISPMDRRSFLAVTGSGLAAVTAAAWTTDADAPPADAPPAASSGRIADAEVTLIEQHTAALQRHDDEHGSGDGLLGITHAYLTRVTALLKHRPATDAQSARLHLAAADLCRLAGQIAIDDGRTSAGQQYLLVGRRAAATAERADRAAAVGAGAHLLAGLSAQATNAGDPAGGLATAEQILALPHGSLTPRLRSLAAGVAARAHARLGDARVAGQLLLAEEQAVERGPSDADPPSLYYHDRSDVAGHAGYVWLQLGDWARAEQALTEALALKADAYPRNRVVLHVRRGQALLGAAQLDAALQAGRDAVTLLGDIQSARSTALLHDLVADAAAAWPGDRRVADFADEARAVLAG
jgi:tetratricopeptide (TPR) repeat protein